MNHRLANIRHADRIIVLDAGRIVAEGTHEQLIAATGSLYQRLFTVQAQGYAAETVPSPVSSRNGETS